MRAPRAAVPVLALTAALLSGCSGSPATPQTTANAYLAAWARQDWAAMQRLTSAPPADFTAVNQAAFGNLTVRQAEVLWLVADGLSNREIAARLYLSAGTVERHLVTIYRKLGLGGRVDAARYAVEHGLAQDPNRAML